MQSHQGYREVPRLSAGFLVEFAPDGGRSNLVAPDGWEGQTGEGWSALVSSSRLIRSTQERVVVATARLNASREHHRQCKLPADADPVLVIDRLHREHGEEIIRRLDGDFAIVVFDQGDLLAVRDHMGVRPLYIASDGMRHAFATHPSLLLQLAWVDRSIDTMRVADYLLSLYEDGEETFYRGVRRLPAGHALRYNRSGRRLWRYWDLDPDFEHQAGSDDQYAERFLQELRRSVRDRLTESSPFGATLSGGLDSSSVTAMARSLLKGRDLHTFSAVFAESPRSDERSYIAKVVDQGGIASHVIEAGGLAPIGSLHDVRSHLFEPFFAPNLFLHAALLRASKVAGCSVLLDGLDGDTAVSHGLARLQELARGLHWILLGQEIRGLATGIASTSPAGLLWRSVVRPLLLRPPRLLLRRLRPLPQSPWGAEALLNEEFARAQHLQERYLTLSEMRSAPAKTQRREHIRRITWPLHGFMLEMLDRLGSAIGVESRYPFYDRGLIELSVSLPADQKLRGGWTRFVLRRSMSGLLPHTVAWRVGKSDLGENFNRAFIRDELRSVRSLVQKNDHAVWEYVDRAAVGESVKIIDSGDKSPIIALWKTLTLAQWLGSNDV